MAAAKVEHDAQAPALLTAVGAEAAEHTLASVAGADFDPLHAPYAVMVAIRSPDRQPGATASACFEDGCAAKLCAGKRTAAHYLTCHPEKCAGRVHWGVAGSREKAIAIMGASLAGSFQPAGLGADLKCCLCVPHPVRRISLDLLSIIHPPPPPPHTHTPIVACLQQVDEPLS